MFLKGYVVMTTWNLEYRFRLVKRYGKRSSPVTGLWWSRGFQEVEVPTFHDNGTGWW
jgi:hypothetical protein